MPHLFDIRDAGLSKEEGNHQFYQRSKIKFVNFIFVVIRHLGFVHWAMALNSNRHQISARKSFCLKDDPSVKIDPFPRK